MNAYIARLDVGNRWRSIVAYAAGLALYTLVVVVLYPAFKNSTSLDDFITSDPTAAALFGVTGSLTSPDGWLNGNIYANFLPLVVLLVTIGYGAAALAGQDEEGTLCLLVLLPIRRDRIVLEKAAAMTFQALVLATAVGVVVAFGRSFELSIPIGNIVAVSIAVALMGIDFGLVTMAVGALTGRRASALGVGTVIAAASYLLSSLAPVVSWLDAAKYASLLYWSVGDGQLGQGVTVADFSVLLGMLVLALYAAMAAFRRLDVH